MFPPCTTVRRSEDSGCHAHSVCQEKLSRWTPFQGYRSFRLSTMATVVATAQEEALHSIETAPLTIPKRVYPADHDSAEKALPVRPMASIPRFRYRALQEQSTRTVGNGEESPTSSGGTLTPDSIQDSQPSQGINLQYINQQTYLLTSFSLIISTESLPYRFLESDSATPSSRVGIGSFSRRRE
jgi:hypothetical protein